jgi:hypothetical protein
MARQIDGQDTNDGVWITLGTTSIGIVELKIDAAGSGNLIVNRSGEPFTSGLARSPGEHSGSTYGRRLTGRTRNMVVELLGALQSDTMVKLIPKRLILPVDEDAIIGPLARSSSWPSSRNVGPIRTFAHSSLRPLYFDKVIVTVCTEEDLSTKRVTENLRGGLPAMEYVFEDLR